MSRASAKSSFPSSAQLHPSANLPQAGNPATKPCRNTPVTAHPAPSIPKPIIAFPLSRVVGAGVSKPILQHGILPAQQKERRAVTTPSCALTQAVGQQHATEQRTSPKHTEIHEVNGNLSFHSRVPLGGKADRNCLSEGHFWFWLTPSKRGTTKDAHSVSIHLN